MLLALGVAAACRCAACRRLDVAACRCRGVSVSAMASAAASNAVINIRRVAGVHPKISDRPVASCAVFCDSLPCHAVSRAACHVMAGPPTCSYWHVMQSAVQHGAASLVRHCCLRPLCYNIFALLRCVLGVDTGALGSPPTCSSQERGGAIRQSLVVAVFVLGEDGDPLAQRYPACFSFSRCSQQSCFLACFDFLYHFHFLALALALPLACSCSVGTL